MNEESTLKDAAVAQPDREPDRAAQPVDDEQPPRLPFVVVGIGASAGGLEAVGQFLDAMRPDAGMAFVLVQHLPPDRESQMAEILGRRTAMPVAQVEDGMAVEPDRVYVIRPGHVLTIREGRLHLGPPLGSARAANRPVDDFFKSLAAEQRERAVCVILSGMGSNGTAGAQAVKAVGGLCVAQDPETAQFPSMPQHLIDAGYADYVLAPADIPEALLTFAGSPYARGGREDDAVEVLRREEQHLREVLAILRTRTKKDFHGYKKPTVLRRVQRRMGLTRSGGLAEYARHLRQSPAEVTALADDLLIHVSGFFRDPEAWQVLRQRAVAQLVAAREAGGEVRAWVTACSSGEEAYSLAMLLVEESDRAGKKLDVKVFATDLADRPLANARAGVYPGGIESEVSPERLERFFQKEDEVYRVRQDLRDRVVFAPQDVLSDPPFGRIDVASCRNLLIYLEPGVQQRVLALLHFGLREGGTLFLGSSETVAGSEDLFEPIDKRARIYRRIGPTRHGAVEFPLPHGLSAGGGSARQRARRDEGPRPSLARVVQQALLAHHTPAAVALDRDHRVLYFHGDTSPYLLQPTGELTRDVLALARQGVRAAVRAALSRAAAEGTPATEHDGWADAGPGRRVRVAVTASPVPGPADAGGAPEHFVVSFTDRGDILPAVAPTAGGDHSAEEFRRLESELQSTIEELQTSNEESKASHEEVVSVNEELQASNEELETSKEEMQSLNEELHTVNAQLRAKAEEYQATSSDLQSLLASTDIAVLFLDPQLRIRRYTPAARELIDLIPGDIGRPLAALTRKFDDRDLEGDCRAVLERLVPAEREVPGTAGRHYLRRVHPYRTIDSRIDGVVVTLVDVSLRKRAEEALRASEEQLRRAIEDAPIPVIMQAEDGRVLQLSRTWTELTGYALEDIPTTDTWLTRAYGAGADAVRTHMHELFQGDRKSLDVEFAIRTRGGEARHWSFSASAPGALRDGRRFLVGMAVDVTDRRRAEGAVRESEERFRLIIEAARGFAMFATDAAGRITAWNPAAEALLGWPEAAALGQPVAMIFVPEDRAAGKPELEMATAEREGRAADERWHVRKDGSRFWGSGELTAARGPGGELRGFVRVMRDETARKLAEDRLRESEERLRVALAAGEMGTWLWRIAEDEQVLDESLRRLMGLRPGEEVQSLDSFLRAVHAEDRGRVRAEFERCRREGGNFTVEFRVTWPDGSRHWLQDQGKAFPVPGGRPEFIAGACVDVTTRKRAEEALARDAQVLAGVRDSVIVTDLAGVVTHWNEGATRLFGWSAEEMVGRPYADRFPEEARAWIAEQIAERAGGSEWSGEFEDWRKDGSRVWIDARVSRVVDAAGRPVAILGVAHDLSERKRMEAELRRANDELEERVRERTAELERLQERALQAGRLAAIGQTVTALAHEGRNALQRATACLSRLEMRQKGRPDELELTGRTQRALGDLERLFDDVRNYAVPVSLRRTACDLAAVWREAWAQVTARNAPRDARLEEEGVTPGCEADAFRMGQVFVNLFTNALEACPDPVRVTVACRAAELGGRPALRVSVRDNGPGFPEEQRRHLFEPFRTTKPTGTGLGMAITKRIAEAHGGTVAVGNGPGAEVILTLPEHRAPDLQD